MIAGELPHNDELISLIKCISKHIDGGLYLRGNDKVYLIANGNSLSIAITHQTDWISNVEHSYIEIKMYPGMKPRRIVVDNAAAPTYPLAFSYKEKKKLKPILWLLWRGQTIVSHVGVLECDPDTLILSVSGGTIESIIAATLPCFRNVGGEKKPENCYSDHRNGSPTNVNNTLLGNENYGNLDDDLKKREAIIKEQEKRIEELQNRANKLVAVFHTIEQAEQKKDETENFRQIQEEERGKAELEKKRQEEERIRSELEKEEIARAQDIEARTFLGILFDTVELANEARWKHEQERMEIEIRAKAEAEIKARIEEERRIKTEQEEARIKAEIEKKRQEEERIKSEDEKKRQEEERIQAKAEKKRLEEEKAKEESLKLRTVRGVVYDTIEAASGAKKEHDEIDKLVESVGKQSKQKTRQSIVANKEMHVIDVYAKKRLEALKTKVNQEEPRIVSLKRILGILVVVVFVAFILAAMCQAPGAILGLVATSWWIALIAFIVVVIICGVNKKKSDWYLNLKDI